ncbi:aspartyl-trna synthetase [Holotrichia oblita]|nr:aspartyl-trna synthetase [Holotrichia oblita]
MAFIVLKDITGKIQITVEKGKSEKLATAADSITLDSVITVIGNVVENSFVKLNGIEVLPEEIIIESIAEPLPINREENKSMINPIQAYMVNAMRSFLTEKNFIEIHSPKLIGTASESGSDVFEVKYFDRNAFLAQTPQFYKQMAMAGDLERIYEIGPVFRAEKSYTNRHTTEFTGFDLEFSYIESYEDIMNLEAELLTDMLKGVKEKYGEQIKEIFGLEVIVPQLPFPVVTLNELYDELEREFSYSVPESEKGDLTTDAEKLSFEWVKKKYDHEFLFVTDYSAEKRAFYHMRKEGVLQGYDLIWRGVEITTGAQREHRYDILKEQAKEKGLLEDVKFYLEFFKYGCPPHGGFGLGVDRMTILLLGAFN